MTIEQLEEIINLHDFDKICEKIEDCGFRPQSKGCIEEFDLQKIKADYAEKSVVTKDENTQNRYEAILYTGGKLYGEQTFILLRLSTFRKAKKNLLIPIPRKHILFTTAPYNKEYIRDMHSSTVCEKCKREFIKKDMLPYEKQFFCPPCFIQKMNSL